MVNRSFNQAATSSVPWAVASFVGGVIVAYAAVGTKLGVSDVLVVLAFSMGAWAIMALWRWRRPLVAGHRPGSTGH